MDHPALTEKPKKSKTNADGMAKDNAKKASIICSLLK